MKSQSISLFSVVTAVTALVWGSACTQHKDPAVVYAPDMHYSVALKAQEPGAMRLPPQGAIPREFRPYSITSLEDAGRVLRNPLPRNKEVFAQGKALFEAYCKVCHGPYGEGDGSVVPKYPRPPSLQSDKIRSYKDGEIFHVITMGQNLMPSYADRLDENERWAVIHYVRALQLAKNPTADALKRYESKK